MEGNQNSQNNLKHKNQVEGLTFPDSKLTEVMKTRKPVTAQKDGHTDNETEVKVQK